ncbi:MAG: DUF1569 domain-containing protein [Niabella sp.]
MIKNIFTEEVANEVIHRINQLKPTDKPHWGKMSVDQMLAHCNVTYAFTYEPEQFKRPSAFKKFLLKTFIKGFVTGEKSYPKNGRTAPEFIITEQKDFEKEKTKLIDNIQKTQRLGFQHFDGKDNFSFGKMTGKEWNALFYKHLDHHLTQFGV